jgi:hypothetical protein
MTRNGSNFSRGDVFHVFFPTTDMTPEHTPPDPDKQLHGRHMVICLTDHNDTNVPSDLVGVVPISKAAAAVRNNRLTSTHLELTKDEFTFLDVDSYALLFQSRPIGRHWLEVSNHVCNILDYSPNIMKQISILSLFVSGAYADVMEFANDKFKESMFTDKQNKDL